MKSGGAFVCADPLAGYDGGMDEQRKQSANALSKLQRGLAYILVLIGLVAWVIAQPPPEHWLPIAALLLAILAVVTRGIVALREGSNVDDKPPDLRRFLALSKSAIGAQNAALPGTSP